MRAHREICGIAGLVLGCLIAAPALAQAPRPVGHPASPVAVSAYSPSRIAFEEINADDRARVRAVVERPTLRAQGPVEVFRCDPAVFHWLLDHPDLAVRLWRAVGATCTDIAPEAAGQFGWRDSQGSHVSWRTVLETSGQRVWYAEGKVKPGVLLPLVAVRAVVILNHASGQDRSGRSAVRQQAELVLQTDNQAVVLAARVVGASAPRVAEQYVGQLQSFFAALAWYLDQEPDHGRTLLLEVASAQGKAMSAKRAP